MNHYITQDLRCAFDEGCKEGKSKTLNELENKLRIWDNKVNAIPNYVWKCIKEMKGDSE